MKRIKKGPIPLPLANSTTCLKQRNNKMAKKYVGVRVYSLTHAHTKFIRVS